DGHGAGRGYPELLRYCTSIQAREHHSSERDRCLHGETVCTWDQCNEPFLTVSCLHATLLRRTAPVVRDRRHVGDAGDFVAAGVKSTHSGFATWTWALDVNVEVLQAILQSSLTSALSGDLGSERSGLTRAAETRTTRGSPGQGVTLTVGNGHDGVVER